MTRPYLQENINQDGNVQSFVGNSSTTEFKLSGSGGLLALVNGDDLSQDITVFLPLANAAGRNAEVTIQLSGEIALPVEITIAGQTFDGNTDNVVGSTSTGFIADVQNFAQFPAQAPEYTGRTFTSNGIDTWVLTAFT
jgi:hypothetical protein